MFRLRTEMGKVKRLRNYEKERTTSTINFKSYRLIPKCNQKVLFT
jgi:hypothetical protein